MDTMNMIAESQRALPLASQFTLNEAEEKEK